MSNKWKIGGRVSTFYRESWNEKLLCEIKIFSSCPSTNGNFGSQKGQSGKVMAINLSTRTSQWVKSMTAPALEGQQPRKPHRPKVTRPEVTSAKATNAETNSSEATTSEATSREVTS